MPRLRPRSPDKRVAYSIAEVMKMTGRARNTIKRWTDRGILQAVPVPGGYPMISAASLEALLEGRAKAPRPGRPRTKPAEES